MDFKEVMNELEALGKERTKKFISQTVHMSHFLVSQLER